MVGVDLDQDSIIVSEKGGRIERKTCRLPTGLTRGTIDRLFAGLGAGLSRRTS